jgi:hypothetical protein
LVCSNMSGSDASVHGRHRDEDAAAPVMWAELHQLQEYLMRAMETMLNECLPAGGSQAPRQHSPTNSHGEVDDENSVGGADDYYFGHHRGHGGRHGHGGHRGGAHGHGFRPMCILMMKIFMKFLIVIWNIITMRTHLPIMGHLDSTMTIIDVLPMVVMNCLIIIIELNL